jgi:uncharacterized protein YqgC (DUF456 family)
METLILSACALLCLTGLTLSLIGFSGTWAVFLAAVVTKFSIGAPNTGTLVIFMLLCVVVELLEALAGFLGVQRRGGSKRAGFAAIVGGLVGAGMGSAFFPIIGTFAGLLVGSFALAFLVEWVRLKHHAEAANIAIGALLARMVILFLKTVVTLFMALWLFYVLA